MDILFQALKLAPRLWWQTYCQPSQIIEFIKQDKKNAYIYALAFELFAFLLGSILAIPLLFSYAKWRFFLLIIVVMCFFIVPCLYIIKPDLKFIFKLTTKGTIFYTAIIIFFMNNYYSGLDIIPSTFVFCFGFMGIALGITTGKLIINIIEPFNAVIFDNFCSKIYYNILFILFTFAMQSLYAFTKIFAQDIYVTEKIDNIYLIFWNIFFVDTLYEINIDSYYISIFIILSICFSYIVFQFFFFLKINNYLKVSQFMRIKFQFLLFALIVVIPALYLSQVKTYNPVVVSLFTYCISVLFIFHIPECIFYLPVWILKIRKISKLPKEPNIIMPFFNNLLFKHEFFYLQLPYLYKYFKILHESDIDIKVIVDKISFIYRFTFQQIQAQKAIIEIGNYQDTIHQFIHLLLQKDYNIPLFKSLVNKNSIAKLYDKLFDLKNINFVCDKMREQKCRFNQQMLQTLELAHNLSAIKFMREFYNIYIILENTENFPQEIKYLVDINELFINIKAIGNDLSKIEAIERIETRRSLLIDQQLKFEVLSKQVAENFYEPFATIWKNSLTHCAEVIQVEISQTQGKAFILIELKNKELIISKTKRELYIEIRNTGEELAKDISIDIECDSAAVSCTENKAELALIESGMTKEISFPVIINSPINTHIRGTLCFSDRARSNKKIPFSFPVSVLKESAVFREISNPYIAGGALSKNTHLLFGREDAYQFINSNIITQDGQHRTIVCHGLRRSGKSSLLYRIEERGFADQRLIPVYVDMQGIDDEKDFYHTLSDKITEKLNGSEIRCRDFGEFKGFVKHLKADLPDKIIVLLMDEFEELQLRVEEKKISKSVFSNIRHLMQHENKLIFVFCGTHKLEEMAADYWSIFFNTATYLKISYLKPEETVKLITEPVKGQLSYDELAVGHIQKLTFGQPYLTQLICHTIVNDLNDRKKRNYAAIDDVDDAAEKIISEGKDKFSEQIWNQATTWERLILSAAAEEMTNKQLDVIGVESLYGKIETAIGKFPRKEYMDTLNRLVSKDILAVKEVRYSFPVNLLRKWIADRHPLAKVRAEIA